MVEPKLLVRFARRIRVARAWRGAAVGGCIGGFAAVVAAALDAFRVAFAEPPTLIGLVLGGAVLRSAVGALLRVRLDDVAESVDRRGGLQNRVRTALNLREGEFAAEQADDARGRLEGLQPKAVFPLRFGRWHAGAIAVAVIAASVFLLGNTTLLLDAQGKKDRAELQKLAPAVERVARPKLDNPTADEKALDAAMRRFAKELERGRLDRPDALAKANELAQKADELARQRFQEAEKKLGTADQALESMLKDEMLKRGFGDVKPEDLMRDPADASAEMQRLDQQIQQMEKKLGEEGLTKAERDALMSGIKDAKDRKQAIELSEAARKTFEKLFNMPEWKELMAMAAKLKKESKAGQAGNQELTAEQVKAMQERLEELARKLKDEAAMREYIEALKAALKDSGEG